MESLRAPILRHMVSSGVPFLRASQRRWAQVHDVRFLATRPSNRILERYKDRLDRKVKEEGLRDINELKEAYKDKIQDFKKASLVPPIYNAPLASSGTPIATSLFPPLPSASQIPTEFAERPTIQTLSSFLNIPKVLTLQPNEIETLWRLRHTSSARSLCATIPIDVYKTIEATAKKHPSFILPLPKGGQGVEIHFLQWTFPAPDTVVVLFTHLAEYKLRGEFSQPHTTITHHLELAEPRGLVLLQGQVLEGRGVSVEEAKWLVMCLQKFYGISSEMSERRKLLESFGRGDESFEVERLVEEAEKLV